MVLNNRYLCLTALSVEILIEHIQVMSFLQDAPSVGNFWNTDAQDAFDVLRKISLRFYDDTFMGLFITAAVIVFLTIVLYFSFNEKLHDWNRKNSTIACFFIWFFEHILFGIGYIPIISQFVAVQYCKDDATMYTYPSIKCWSQKHITLLEIGYVFSGFALFIAGVIGPIFKAERPKGVERKFGNQSYFLGIYKLLLFSVAYLFAPAHSDNGGIALTVITIAFLFVWESFKELHVASMYMAVLMAQLWIFICVSEVNNSSSTGSDMLAGWLPMLVFGYIILPIKSLIVARKPREIPIEKE